jgi:hypothetical protein
MDKIKPVNFSEKEISVFNAAAALRGVMTVSTDISKPESPLWVNSVLLTNFCKLHIHHWKRVHQTYKQLADEQCAIFSDILLKIKHVFNIAIRHSCLTNQWIDLRKLLKITQANKKANMLYSTYFYNPYNVLEIEKVALEQSKNEFSHDVLDEMLINDLITLTKMMARQMHDFIIP